MPNETELLHVWIRHGLGRAVLHLSRVGSALPKRLVLRWQGLDAQTESLRGAFNADLINSATNAANLRRLLFLLMSKPRADVHGSVRAKAVGELARRGDQGAREVLYENANVALDWLVEEIIALDGVEGLRWLSTRQDEWPEDYAWKKEFWLDEIAERGGTSELFEWLCSEDPLAGPFNRCRLRQRSPEPQLLIPPSVEDYLEGRVKLLQFKKFASEREFARAAALVLTSSLEAVRRLIRLFDPEHLFPAPERLIDILLQNLDEAYNPYLLLASKFESPEFRRIGVDLLSSHPVAAVALLCLNAQAEDELSILEAFRRWQARDRDAIHSAVLDLLSLSRRLSLEFKVEILLWIYENSPCSFCRGSAVCDLLEINALPDGLRDECHLDADEETRAAVAR